MPQQACYIVILDSAAIAYTPKSDTNSQYMYTCSLHVGACQACDPESLFLSALICLPSLMCFLSSPVVECVYIYIHITWISQQMRSEDKITPIVEVPDNSSHIPAECVSLARCCDLISDSGTLSFGTQIKSGIVFTLVKTRKHRDNKIILPSLMLSVFLNMSEHRPRHVTAEPESNAVKCSTLTRLFVQMLACVTGLNFTLK